MAKEVPCYILRDCLLFIDRQNKIGQIGDVTLPALEAKREDMRNGGMIRPRKVYLGYEATEFSFKMPGFDPQVLKLFGLALGVETPFMITGALVDEDGQVHSGVISVRGILYKPNHGTWKGGDLAENDYAVDVRWHKLEVDGEPIQEVDDFVISIGGQVQNQGIRNALLL
ncbi:phage major tail tube protein [Rhizobium flavescens]|uniref:phage major tail tube protein n=1 Tax=Rhizobium flavescens TaxID=2607407 RepID=UPI00140CBBB8|nr:phage major tail tube protein [Rhizobium flavescens]